MKTTISRQTRLAIFLIAVVIPLSADDVVVSRASPAENGVDENYVGKSVGSSSGTISNENDSKDIIDETEIAKISMQGIQSDEIINDSSDSISQNEELGNDCVDSLPETDNKHSCNNNKVRADTSNEQDLDSALFSGTETDPSSESKIKEDAMSTASSDIDIQMDEKINENKESINDSSETMSTSEMTSASDHNNEEEAYSKDNHSIQHENQPSESEIDASENSSHAELSESNPNSKEQQQLENEISNDTNAGDEQKENDQSTDKNNGDEDEEDVGAKERVVVNYAHKSAGAVVLEKSNSFKGTSNLLTSDNDRYAIAPCDEKKSVVIGLSEDILVKQIVLANFERYSSHIKDFQVLGSQTYPIGNWHDLGTYRAQPGNGAQKFDLNEPSWARYLKFRFVSHYGEEHFCTVSQIKVHGSTMLQGFHEQWSQSEKEEQEMLQNNDDEELLQKHDDLDSVSQQNESVRDDSANEESSNENINGSVVEHERGENDSSQTVNAIKNNEEGKRSPDISTGNEFNDDHDSEEVSTTTNEVNHASGGDTETSESVDDSREINTGINASEDLDKTNEEIKSADDSKVDIDAESLVDEQDLDSAKHQKDDLTCHGANVVNESDDEIEMMKAETTEDETVVIIADSASPLETKGITKIDEKVEDLKSNEDNILVVDNTDVFYGKISEVVKKIREGTLSVSDAVNIITESSSVSYETVKNLIKDSISKQIENSTKEESLVSPTVQSEDKSRKSLQSESDSQSIEKTVPVTSDVEVATEKTYQSEENNSHSEKSPNVVEADSHGTKINYEKAGEVASIGDSVSKKEHVESNPSGTIMNSNSEKISTLPANTKNQPLSESPTDHSPNSIGSKMNSSTISALLTSSQSIPSISCIDNISDFNDFKAKVTAQRSAKLNSSSGSGTSAVKMEPIFKTLTDELKTLQLHQTIYDQYLRSVVACHQQVILEMAQEINRIETAREKRMTILEKSVEELMNAKQQENSSGRRHDGFLSSKISSITLAAAASSSIQYFFHVAKPLARVSAKFLNSKLIALVGFILNTLKSQDWLSASNSNIIERDITVWMENNLGFKCNWAVGLISFFLIWQIKKSRKNKRENKQLKEGEGIKKESKASKKRNKKPKIKTEQ